MHSPLNQLQQRLGYTFRNPELLLTPSHCGEVAVETRHVRD